MIQPYQRRRRRGPGPVLPILLILLLLGGLVALAVMEPPYAPKRVEQPIDDAKLPL